MMVVDASALAHALLAVATDSVLAALLGETLHAPHVIDLEVTQTLRRLRRVRSVETTQFDRALEDLAEYPVQRHAHQPYLSRIWELRDRLSAYDAAYLALAEALGCPLLTCDAGLAAVAASLRIAVV